MSHAIYRVLSFEIIGPHQLRVRFDDGVSREIDFQPILHVPLYESLRQLSVFNSVSLDPEVQTLVWPNGADFDPATLHDWPKYVSQLGRIGRNLARGADANRQEFVRTGKDSVSIAQRTQPMPVVAPGSLRDEADQDDFARIMLEVEREDWFLTAQHDGSNTEEGGCI